MVTGDESKLFVAGLPNGITEESLRELFTSAGANVEELTLPRDRASGRPRGFAFVRLASVEDAESARNKLDGTMMDGRPIRVRPFSAEPPTRSEGGEGGRAHGDTSDRTLYLGNLPYQVSEQDVRDLFSQAGAESPRQIHLPVDPGGRPRGFGFVTFETAESANDALAKVREPVVGGRRCVLHLALPKGSRPPPREGGFGGPRGPRPDGPGGFDDRPPRSFGGGGGGAGDRGGFAPRPFDMDSPSAKDAGRKRKAKPEAKPDPAARRRSNNKRGRSWDDDDF
jgi:nucleolin